VVFSWAQLIGGCIAWMKRAKAMAEYQQLRDADAPKPQKALETYRQQHPDANEPGPASPQ